MGNHCCCCCDSTADITDPVCGPRLAFVYANQIVLRRGDSLLAIKPYNAYTTCDGLRVRVRGMLTAATMRFQTVAVTAAEFGPSIAAHGERPPRYTRHGRRPHRFFLTFTGEREDARVRFHEFEVISCIDYLDNGELIYEPPDGV